MTRSRKAEQDHLAVLDLIPPDLRRREQLRRIEAVLFAASELVDEKTLRRAVGPDADIESLMAELSAWCAGRGYEVARANGKWRLVTARDLGAVVRDALQGGVARRRPLSRAEIEILAIVAYHQPVTLSEISGMRAKRETRTDSLRNLMEAGWVALGPRRNAPGRPQTFVTTERFLDHFGLPSLADLPDVDRLRAEGLLEGDDRFWPLVDRMMDPDGSGSQAV